jgi:UV DNA damage endonuclease
MRIGYPCINLTLGCKAASTFRLKSYSEERLIRTIDSNLDCLQRILQFNVEHGILFFRITSDLVPFASHSICTFDWQSFFQERFQEIGGFLRSEGIRISMHPDQFTLINSPRTEVHEHSKRELAYHAQVLDLLGLDLSAKIQIHAGGVYSNKEQSVARFLRRYGALDNAIRRRLVLENDDRLYTLGDCLEIGAQSGIPILFDSYHHQLNCSGETLLQALEQVARTWGESDGLPMVDYSHSEVGVHPGKHAASLYTKHFKSFLDYTSAYDFDVMLEIKDKEASALRAVAIARKDRRFESKRVRDTEVFQLDAADVAAFKRRKYH